MKDTLSDETMSHLNSAAKLFVVNENAGVVPAMVDFWNAGAGPDKLDSNMTFASSTILDATSLGFLRRCEGRPLQSNG